MLAPACPGEGNQPLTRIFRLQPRRRELGLALEIVADLDGIAAPPLGEIVVRAGGAAAHGAHVDGFGEAQWQFALGAGAALPDDDLRGDVAPVDNDEAGHGRYAPELLQWRNAACGGTPLFTLRRNHIQKRRRL